MPESHRLVTATSLLGIQNMDAPFSCFDTVEGEFGGSPAVHRGFSIARAAKAQTVVFETIPARGMIKEENEDFILFHPDFTMEKLVRVSFWKSAFKTERGLDSRESSELAGYMLLKRNRWDNPAKRRWNVFDAIFLKYDHHHNCVPNQTDYAVRIGKQKHTITGVLYAQQNGVTNACAHVALRSLISRRVPGKDVSYRRLNQIAEPLSGPDPYKPGNGLSTDQMRAILDYFKIRYRDVDYKGDSDLQESLPYTKYVYAGIESGAGSLVGFQLQGSGAPEEEYHIIPFYGHTFNKDTWVPDAEMAYFDIGGSIGYIPSISWTSSFIGHDDNFGANFCVNRLYIKPENVAYAVELLPEGYRSGGTEAETYAAGYFYALTSTLKTDPNPWVKRTLHAANSQPVPKIILRAVAVDRTRYLDHLQHKPDWQLNTEDPGLIKIFHDVLPEKLWVVEVSLPQLFPANERKVGELLLRGDVDLSKNPPGGFLLSRFPGTYYLAEKSQKKSTNSFVGFPSELKSHTPVIPSS